MSDDSACPSAAGSPPAPSGPTQTTQTAKAQVGRAATETSIHTSTGSPGASGASGRARAVGGAVTSRLPGLALAVCIAAVATVLGGLVPVVGGPVTGIVLGVLVAVVVKPGALLRPGIAFAGRGVLQSAVVVLGAQLSLGQVLEVGLGSLPVMVVTLAVCLAAAYWLGRRLGIGRDLRTLIGVGTGICGASAIAAVTPVIAAAEAEVAYAVSTIFVFNVTAVLAFPVLGHLLGMGQHAFGLFAGTAVNDMSSVVAAATTYGSSAANYAVVVKLARTLLIIPVCLGLAALARRRAAAAATAAGPAEVDPSAGRRLRVGRLVPWFLIGFIVLAGANSAGLVPHAAHQSLSTLSVFLITVALSAIGLSTDPAKLRRTGPAPLVLGGLLWVVVSATSLATQFVIGRL